MGNVLAHQDVPAQAEALPPSAEETALHLALQQARALAAQSRLIAMNAAFESAAACREAADAQEMEALGRSAGRTAEEMERVAASVELILQQIRSASALSRPL